MVYVWYSLFILVLFIFMGFSIYNNLYRQIYYIDEEIIKKLKDIALKDHQDIKFFNSTVIGYKQYNAINVELQGYSRENIY